MKGPSKPAEHQLSKIVSRCAALPNDHAIAIEAAAQEFVGGDPETKFLVLHDFLDGLARMPVGVVELFNDRESYFLALQQWARNLDNRETVIARFGDFNYRRFAFCPWVTAALDVFDLATVNPASAGAARATARAVPGPSLRRWR
jgi:hypothetical protein